MMNRRADMDITGLWRDHADWSRATFGSDLARGPLGPIRHLQREAVELEEKPFDPLEYADALLLVFDAARRSGLDLEELVTAAKQKLEINRAREWPAFASPDQPIEHLK